MLPSLKAHKFALPEQGGKCSAHGPLARTWTQRQNKASKSYKGVSPSTLISFTPSFYRERKWVLAWLGGLSKMSSFQNVINIKISVYKYLI